MKKTRIAAMADLHIGREGHDYSEDFKELSLEADILVLCGDLTDRGSEEQTLELIQQLTSCKVPVICVLGNHDYEGEEEDRVTQLLQENKIHVLNGTSTVVEEIGFAGIKGFCGGFDSFTLAPWGERAIKEFVHESIQDSLQLEKALSELDTKKKVVLLHYSPISATVKGEPLELYPFLGCSRLISPIHRLHPDVVFHGHAHHGTHEGKTLQGDIPVYNVSVPVNILLERKKKYVIKEI